jgi:hypothetical protein
MDEKSFFFFNLEDEKSETKDNFKKLRMTQVYFIFSLSKLREKFKEVLCCYWFVKTSKTDITYYS